MKNRYHLRKILLVGFVFMCFSCDKEEFTGNNLEKSNGTSKSNATLILNGPEIAVGNGLVHSWISLDSYKKPIEIGIELTSGTFENLPDKSDFKKPVNIPLPKYALEATAFNHIGLNWSPENFSTIEGFKEAHFDVHFYLISESKRLSIPEWSEETDPKFSNYPPKYAMPFDYSPIIKRSGSFATIGRYWLSDTQMGASLNNHTIAMGTFDGSLVFIDPVVTLNFLKSEKKVNDSFSQAVNNPLNNLLPREYNIYTNAKGNYCISLGNFIRR